MKVNEDEVGKGGGLPTRCVGNPHDELSLKVPCPSFDAILGPVSTSCQGCLGTYIT